MYDMTNNVQRIYTGIDNCCRCGCKGTYHEKGTRGFNIALNKFKKILREGLDHANLTVDETYADLGFGNDRSITLYFK